MTTSDNHTQLNIDDFANRFRARYVFKKNVNALLCFFIFLCGTSGVLYSVFVYHNSLFDRLRFMTIWGTIFTSVVSLVFSIVAILEVKKYTEVTSKVVYFLRLSSATTEVVILAVVLLALTPFIPDVPDLNSYTGIMMHLVVPITTVMSFIFNDSPIGKPKLIEPLIGTSYIAIYTTVMTILFGSGMIPSSKAPYSFLDFSSNSMRFKITCLIGVFVIGYIVSWILILLNMKFSWIWFTDLKKHRRRG